MWEQQRDDWSDGWEVQGGTGDSLCVSSPQPPYCPSLQGPHGVRDLGSCLCHVPSGTTVVLDGTKVIPLPISPDNCLSNTFLAYLPTPREPWDKGRGAPPPHTGQKPDWHCPS